MTRMFPPLIKGVSPYFVFLNRCKKGLTLDLKKQRGKEIFEKMVKQADIVVENFSPGTMEGWGLGYDDLKKVKPDCIMLRISNQGQTGPWSKVPSYGTLLTAMAGFSEIIGWPDRDPLMLNLAWPDFIAAPIAAFISLPFFITLPWLITAVSWFPITMWTWSGNSSL